jgi:hypothetical protein
MGQTVYAINKAGPDRWVFVKIARLNGSLFKMIEYFFVFHKSYKYDQIILLFVITVQSKRHIKL